MAEVISSITGRSVGVLNDDMTEIKSAITGRTLYFIDGAGGGSPPKGNPVTPVTPATTGEFTEIEWKNGGIYSLNAVADMLPILFTAPDGAAGISTFELHLRQSAPVVSIDWAMMGLGIDLIWPDYDGWFELYGNNPPAFDTANTEYVIVVRYYADDQKYYANVAYSRELESE